MRLYLAGPIYGCTDDEVFGWRDQVRADPLGKMCELVDPSQRDYRGAEEHYAVEVVASDKACINACDALLAYCWKPSYGTAMEVLQACQQNKIVVVVSDARSPWLLNHADLVTSDLGHALQYLHMWAMTG